MSIPQPTSNMQQPSAITLPVPAFPNAPVANPLIQPPHPQQSLLQQHIPVIPNVQGTNHVIQHHAPVSQSRSKWSVAGRFFSKIGSLAKNNIVDGAHHFVDGALFYGKKAQRALKNSETANKVLDVVKLLPDSIPFHVPPVVSAKVSQVYTTVTNFVTPLSLSQSLQVGAQQPVRNIRREPHVRGRLPCVRFVPDTEIFTVHQNSNTQALPQNNASSVSVEIVPPQNPVSIFPQVSLTHLNFQPFSTSLSKSCTVEPIITTIHPQGFLTKNSSLAQQQELPTVLRAHFTIRNVINHLQGKQTLAERKKFLEENAHDVAESFISLSIERPDINYMDAMMAFSALANDVPLGELAILIKRITSYLDQVLMNPLDQANTKSTSTFADMNNISNISHISDVSTRVAKAGKFLLPEQVEAITPPLLRMPTKSSSTFANMNDLCTGNVCNSQVKKGQSTPNLWRPAEEAQDQIAANKQLAHDLQNGNGHISGTAQSNDDDMESTDDEIDGADDNNDLFNAYTIGERRRKYQTDKYLKEEEERQKLRAENDKRILTGILAPLTAKMGKKEEKRIEAKKKAEEIQRQTAAKMRNTPQPVVALESHLANIRKGIQLKSANDLNKKDEERANSDEDTGIGNILNAVSIPVVISHRHVPKEDEADIKSEEWDENSSS
jgi:hypothetical protein